MLNRLREWKEFAVRVERHVQDYTVPQYGDAPGDQIEEWTAKETVNAIRKRADRHGKNSRANQDLLDLLKMAHEAGLAYFKLTGEKPYLVEPPKEMVWVVERGERGAGGRVRGVYKTEKLARERVKELRSEVGFHPSVDWIGCREVPLDEAIQ